jgi:hypothetical protein
VGPIRGNRSVRTQREVWRCQLIRTDAVPGESTMKCPFLFFLGTQGGTYDLPPALESFGLCQNSPQ